MDLFDFVADERRRLADMLDGFTDEQWTTASCCDGWTLEDVVAHLTVVWNYSTLDYVQRSLAVPSTWFRPRKSLMVVNEMTRQERKAIGRAALIADVRAHIQDRTSPPIFGAQAPLTDIVIHRRDIMLPLGIEPDADPEHARAALSTAATRKFALFSRRSALAGLRLRATDIDWVSGDGPELSGPAVPLAHAAWGRSESLAELDGPGVEILRTRLV